MEGTAGRRIHGTWYFSFQDRSGFLQGQPRVCHGDRIQKSPGIGMKRIPVDLLAFADFHQISQIHDAHPVGYVPHHGQVVGNEQVGKAELLLKIAQHIDDLRLDGYIQSGDGFVQDQELRVDDQSPGNTDSLPLSPGKLMGIAVDGIRGKVYHTEGVTAFFFHFCLCKPQLRCDQGFLQDLADGHPPVQRGIRILENHLHFPPCLPQLLLRPVGDILPVQKDLSVRGFIKPDDGPGNRGFSAAGFSHKSQRLPLPYGEAHVLHGVNDPFLCSRNGKILF